MCVCGSMARCLLALLLVPLLQAGAFAQDKLDPAVETFQKSLSDRSVDREKLRQEILGFIRARPGTSAAVQAAGLLPQLPSPLDKLDPKQIPELDRFDWQPKELVAVIGEHRGRHGNHVACLTWSRDGKRVFSGGNQGYVRCFDAATLRPLWLVGTGYATTCLDVSSDNKTLAAGNSHGGLYVWDISTEKPVQTGHFQIGTSTVYSVDISPDNKLLAAGVYDGIVHTFDLDSNKPRARTQLSGHQAPVRAVRFSPAGQTLAAGAADGSIRFWNFRGDRIDEASKVTAHDKALSCMNFSSQGTTLVAGCDDGHVVWVGMGARPAKRGVFKTPAAVTSIGYSPSGTLTSSHADGIVRAWSSTAIPRETMQITGHFGSVTGFSYSPDGRMIATGGHDWTVRQWLLGGVRPTERFPLKGHWSCVRSGSFAPSGAVLACGSEDRSARLWDLSRPLPAQQAYLLHKDNTAVYTVTHSPDGKLLASGGNSTIGRLWDLNRRGELKTFPNHPGAITQMYFLPDSKRLLAASHKTVLMWNVETAREIYRFESHEQRVNALTMSPDGRYALSGTGYYAYKDGKIVTINGEIQYDDCTIRLWDLKDGKLKQEVTKQERPISSLTFAPDGKTFACGMWKLPTSLWEAGAEGLKKKGEVKNTSIWSHIHVFSPDGKRVVTLGQDGLLRLTDVATDKVVKQPWSFQETITNVTFSPDSRYLAVSIVTGPVYILRLDDAPEAVSGK